MLMENIVQNQDLEFKIENYDQMTTMMPKSEIIDEANFIKLYRNVNLCYAKVFKRYYR